jgi:hypothetical protein
MKQLVLIVLLVVAVSHTPAFAEGVRLDIAHFEGVGGALTMSPEDPTPLPDGAVGQLIADVNDEGLAVPLSDGTPGDGDEILGAGAIKRIDALKTGIFAVNGAHCFGNAGYFLVESAFLATTVPSHSIALRIFNSSDPSTATGYWDSPLYVVLPGYQQISFTRAEWTWHPHRSMNTDPLGPSIPLNHDVLSAYPNPFNSSTRIAFVLARTEHVVITVFDLQGRQVSKLLDSDLPAGTHERIFSAANLPSGLYFISLQTGAGMATVRKLLLVR